MARRSGPDPLLYEDDALVVVDKPPACRWCRARAGAPTPACRRARRRPARRADCGWCTASIATPPGALAFAAHRRGPSRLVAGLRASRCDKAYRALVAGVPVAPTGAIDLPLHEARQAARRRPATAGEPGAREASTAYACSACGAATAQAFALVEALPHHRAPSSDPRAPARHRHTGSRPTLSTDAATRWCPRDPRPRLALHASRLDSPHPAGRAVSSPWRCGPRPGTFTSWLDAHWAKEPPS